MNLDQHKRITGEARAIAFGSSGDGGKHADYNAGHQDLYKVTGLVGRCADIWRKAIRFAIAMGTGRFSEKLREDALDLLNYCTMYVVVYDERKEKEDGRSD